MLAHSSRNSAAFGPILTMIQFCQNRARNLTDGFAGRALICRDEELDTRMTIVSIVYYSHKGHTGTLAHAVAHGAASVEGVQMHLLPILPEHVVNGRYKNEELMQTLDRSDAIIFGTPTFMGSVSAVFKAFMEATFPLWFEQ